MDSTLAAFAAHRPHFSILKSGERPAAHCSEDLLLKYEKRYCPPIVFRRLINCQN